MASEPIHGVLSIQRPLNAAHAPAGNLVTPGRAPLPLLRRVPAKVAVLPERGAGRRPGDGAYSSIDISARFGERLRDLRKQHNMTQLEMSVHFGIDRSFISDVERGRKSIGLPLLEVIALGLEISLSDLLRNL